MTDETPSKGRRRAARAVEAETVVDDIEEAADTESRGLTVSKGRATPGRRQASAEQEEERRGFFGRIVDYVQGVRSELDKVAWPSREQVRSLFTTVLIVTIIAASVLGLVTFLFNELFVIGLQNPVIFVVFGAVVAVAVFLYSRRPTEAGPHR